MTNSNSTNSEPIYLTKKMFLEKVFDYENNPETWKYLGDKPAIIDFFATWCGPCKAISPVLDELAKEYAGKLYIYKVDIDQESDLTANFGINSVPTFLFIPMNENPQMAVGMLSKENLIQTINSILLK